MIALNASQRTQTFKQWAEKNIWRICTNAKDPDSPILQGDYKGVPVMFYESPYSQVIITPLNSKQDIGMGPGGQLSIPIYNSLKINTTPMTSEEIEIRKFCIQIATNKVLNSADQPAQIISCAEEIYQWITSLDKKPENQLSDLASKPEYIDVITAKEGSEEMVRIILIKKSGHERCIHFSQAGVFEKLMVGWDNIFPQD